MPKSSLVTGLSHNQWWIFSVRDTFLMSNSKGGLPASHASDTSVMNSRFGLVTGIPGLLTVPCLQG